MSQKDEYYVAQDALGMYAVMRKGSFRPMKLFKTKSAAEQRLHELMTQMQAVSHGDE
jgi:hypothetical protein